MNEHDPVYRNLLETSWRRELTPAEQARLEACLAAHEPARAGWREEAALNGLLRALPKAPLASNFTAQVLRAVQAEQARRARSSVLGAWWEDWAGVLLPKAAWAALALLLGVASLQQYRAVNRASIARDLARMPVVTTLPTPELLQDFEAIRELRHLPVAARGPAAVSDEELLAALQ